MINTRYHQADKTLPHNTHYVIRNRTIASRLSYHHGINTLRPRKNGRHFADEIFKCIFLNDNAWILLKISLKFVPKFRINNNPALVQIMAWRRPGDKPLYEPMMDNLLTHTCVTRAQWVNVICHWHIAKIAILNLWVRYIVVIAKHIRHTLDIVFLILS